MLSTLFAAMSRALPRIAMCLLLTGTIWAQQSTGSLQGTVADSSGAVIPGAAVEVVQTGKVVQHTQSDGVGNFAVNGLAPGEYRLRVTSNGFKPFESEPKKVVAGAATQAALTLEILAASEQVTVTTNQPGMVSLDSTDNASAVVLKGADLDALPDDPDELKADLQALAGPSVGSGGTQTYVDGFSSSRLPPKNAISEVRINQDPFSAQYDHVGYGRVEVITKPGADQLHGTLQYRMSDAAFNSRNPYLPINAPYQANLFTGTLGGPLNKRASFFLDFEGRWATDNEVVNATVLGPSLNVSPLMQAVLMPDNERSVSGRIDYKLNDKNTLTGRYEWDTSQQANAGVGGFLLPSAAYTLATNTHTLQLTENAILSNTALNQTRFQYTQTALGQQAANFTPSVQVLDAFTSGGSAAGNSLLNDGLLELQNYTTKTIGAHTLMFGGEIQRESIYNNSPANFAGTYVFSGGLAPELNAANQVVIGPNGSPVMAPLSSIQVYQRTLALQQAGYSTANIFALGGGPSQFSIAAGQPVSALVQTDLGLFVQDSWRIRPNLTLNAGLRWEGQNTIHDWRDFAPRFGLAWMPAGRNGKTVIRFGTGIFYDRFPGLDVLATQRFNGATQQQFIVNNPMFYPQVPSIAALQAMGLPQTIRTLASNLQAPYVMQTSLGIEREMPFKTVVSLTYINTHGVHQLVSQNIAAPLNALAALSGTGNLAGNYQYTSAGVLNENQFVVSVRRPFRNGFTVFGRYEYNRAFSNTDGVNSFVMNQSNLQADYGRALTDIRHTVALGGTMAGPFGTMLIPTVFIRSGAPFNIITGTDYNGDMIYNDRPAFATLNTPGAVVTPYGIFNPNPGPGAMLIPHNYGQGPAFAMVNFRLSRTFGFGGVRGGDAESGKAARFTGRSLFGPAPTEQRYNLTVGVIVRNALNTVNPGLPVGNLSSPYFGRANWLASTAGPAAMAYGNNRRVQLLFRFDF